MVTLSLSTSDQKITLDFIIKMDFAVVANQVMLKDDGNVYNIPEVTGAIQSFNKIHIENILFGAFI